MDKVSITLTVNGNQYSLEVDPDLRLVDLLREELGLTGTKEGCGEGECGACNVIMNGATVQSCMVPVVRADGSEIETIEGVGSGDDLHPLQEAFIEYGAVQCGFCTPGMIITAKNFLDRNPSPTEEEIRQAISRNICRCTGYTKIVEAIKSVADKEGAS
ncbi:MAG: (2Fe-2S)-binding protein [Bacillota bacterium]